MSLYLLLPVPNTSPCNLNHLFTISTVIPSHGILRRPHEKPYFPGPGISWKAQKDQVNITFTSTFWLKKDRISHHRKDQNKNFLVAQHKNISVISKYHLSINFLPQKRPHFLPRKSPKQERFSNQ